MTIDYTDNDNPATDSDQEQTQPKENVYQEILDEIEKQIVQNLMSLTFGKFLIFTPVLFSISCY